MKQAIHIDGQIICDITSDDLNGDYGTITLLDTETDNEFTIGGYEFEMEYERL